MRPVDIEADVKEMERRKRVEAIMQSQVRRKTHFMKLRLYYHLQFQLFREELERVVGDSLRDTGSDSIAGLISDVMNIKTGSKLSSSSFTKLFISALF